MRESNILINSRPTLSFLFSSFSTLPLEQSLINSGTSLKSLHLLKIQQRIEYKILSITYKTFHSGQHSYLPSLLSVQSNRVLAHLTSLCKRSSVCSRFKVIWQVFYPPYAPVLLNYLPKPLRQHWDRASITRHSNWFYSSTCPLLASVSL